jgi:uncharacterized protein DUF1236
MPPELSREQEQRGTRRLLLGAAVVAAVLLVAFVLWPLLLPNKIGTPPGGAKPSTTPDVTKSRGAPAQHSAESTIGKSNPAGPEDATGGRERQIKETSRALQLSDSQREQLKQILTKQNPPKTDKADFELMIGAAVPGQAPLQDIPPEITQVMNGYWGDQYLIVRNSLVIVDQHSRRVVAIVPGVA